VGANNYSPPDSKYIDAQDPRITIDLSRFSRLQPTPRNAPNIPLAHAIATPSPDLTGSGTYFLHED